MSKLEKLIQELCPNGVEYKLFKEVCKFQNGFAFSSSKFSDEGYPILRITNINNGIIENNNFVYFKKEDYENVNFETYEVKQGDVVVAMSGATTGKIGINLTESVYYLNQRVGLFVPNKEMLNNKFMYYWLCSISNEIYNISSRAGAQPNLSSVKMMEFKLPIPPMEVQSEIVRILDNFTLLTAELTAELTTELTERKEQYDCYRNKLIDEVVGRKGKLIELLVQPVTDGPHTTPVLFNEGVPFVSATSVYDGKVHLEDMKGYISKKYDEECSKKYKPKKFDVYMVKSGSTTGKVAIVDFEADFNIWSPLAALRTASAIQAWYLYHLLQTQNVQEQVFSRMSHGSQPNLSMRVIEQFDVVIPSLEEQERIVNILNKFDSYCNDITQGLSAEIELRKQQYEYYRSKLLTFKELE